MQPRDLVLRRSGIKGSACPKMCAVSTVAVLVLYVWSMHGESFTIAGNATKLPATLQSLSKPVDAARPGLTKSQSPLLLARSEQSTPQPPVVLRAATPAIEMPAGPPADVLVQQPLPNCSVVFFHHLEKTAGTTLRSVFQRNAQLGHFDFFSFVNRFNKVQFQLVNHRLDALRERGEQVRRRL